MFPQRDQQFFLVSSDSALQEVMLDLWPHKVSWQVFERGRQAIERIFHDPPDLLAVDSLLEDMQGFELVRLVKNENVYRQVPVVLCLGEHIPEDLFDFSHLDIDDFLLRPITQPEARARLGLTWYRSTRALDANPLTKLPGNTSIIQRIQDLIDSRQDFALGYFDLDHFKAFNDKYGFSRGDEVLMMTSRIIVNTLRSFIGLEGFVGHVGGDDFVFILPPHQAEMACQGIINNFDAIIPHFYDPADRNQGHIQSVDRQGRTCTYPLMSVSIGVVFNHQGSLQHYGQASQTAMNLKKKAKEKEASSYALDRRSPSANG